MDRNEEDMKLVGFFGIFKHSFKLIFSNKKLFTQLTLISILPLTLIFIADLEMSNHVFWRIENNLLPYDANDSRESTPLEWFCYLLYRMAYFILLTIFSFLSTATIAFAVASIYASRDATCRQVIKIVPKIWKKLFVTFACIYLALFIYNLIYRVILVIMRAIFGYSTIGFAVGIIIIIIIYLFGFLYLSVVLQLASVVTVLENIHGLKAIKKGKDLASGKKKVGMGVALVLYVFLVGLVLVYFLFVAYGDEAFEWGLVARVMMGILCAIMVMVLFLVFVVTQTVLYLVCKSHHREAIDRLSLSTFLGAYVEETVVYPKPGDEIQLGRSQTPSQQV